MKQRGKHLIAVLALCLIVLTHSPFSQTDDAASDAGISAPSRIRVGEKLSYILSFNKFSNAGYAELYVASRGVIGGREAIEIRSRLKTLDLVSAAFLLVDESRNVYAAPDTTLPVYINKTSYIGPIPKESIFNFLNVPTSNYDIVTMIYKVREAGGVGTYLFREGERVHSATFQTTISERVTTDAGEYDTTVSTVESDFLASKGIRKMRLNLSTDDARLPVMLRFTTAKGEFRAMLSAVSVPETIVGGTLPVVIATPTPLPVVRRTPAPVVYAENKPLAPELGFQIGETLDYRVTSAGRPAGIISLRAVDRKLFENEDSLLLTATVTQVEPGNHGLQLGDFARAQVDPETLAPRWSQIRFNSQFIGTKQTVTSDKKTGQVHFGGPNPIDAPIGTHNMISLIYAMRSFNLKPSKDPSNPVNDTRVAVFWESQPYIFTLRPSNSDTINFSGEKVSAQMITINTGDRGLDSLAIKVWLSTEGRVPLRFSAGAYQAELISLPGKPAVSQPRIRIGIM